MPRVHLHAPAGARGERNRGTGGDVFQPSVTLPLYLGRRVENGHDVFLQVGLRVVLDLVHLEFAGGVGTDEQARGLVHVPRILKGALAALAVWWC